MAVKKAVKKRRPVPRAPGAQPADLAVERVVSEIKKGGMVIVVDDEHRENEATSSWRPRRRRPRL